MGTTADKLAKLAATKADLKAAIKEKGQTVGDVFSTYPAAVRAIKQEEKVNGILELDREDTVSIDSILESYPNAYIKTDNNFRKRVSIKKGTPETFGYDEGQVVYHLWVKISDGGEEKYMILETARVTDYAVSGKIYNIVG